MKIPDRAFDANLDGLAGPNHNYAGLSFGNVASQKNRGEASNPRLAALQGLHKMRVMVEAGVPQLLLPPQLRPDFDFLRRLGFHGKPAEMLEAVYRAEPALLAAAWSSSAMWAANAATFSPSADHARSHAQVTPANLVGTLHRALESRQTAHLLQRILPASAGFQHHPALPSDIRFGDEGAANHTRFAPFPGGKGLHVFVHGRAGNADGHRHLSVTSPEKYPARHTLEAGLALVRQHRLADKQVLHLRQNPHAIDAGVFHNDVIAVGHGGTWFVHEQAYAEGEAALAETSKRYRALARKPMHLLRVTPRQLSLREAVTTYFFNSQFYADTDGSLSLICAEESETNAKSRRLLQRAVSEGLIRQWQSLDLRQSMRNGGGPACLRLRLVLTPRQWQGLPQGIIMTPAKLDRLEAWVKKHYRDRLSPQDLRDDSLATEVQRALSELARLLELPDLYAMA